LKNVKKGFCLSEVEVEFLEGRLKCLQGAVNYEVRNRVKGVLFVGGASRMKNEEAARRCEVHVRTLRSWLARYRDGGFEALKRKSVSGRPSNLSLEQKEELKSMVKGSPEAVGYDTGIWTAALACEVVKKRYGVSYSLHSMQKLLGKLGLSFKLPKKNLRGQTQESSRSGWT
jgi:transposase